MQPRARGLSDAKRNKELSSDNSKTGPGVQIYVFHQRASNLENFWLIWQVVSAHVADNFWPKRTGESSEGARLRNAVSGPDARGPRWFVSSEAILVSWFPVAAQLGWI
jgi:hypothetical protein